MVLITPQVHHKLNLVVDQIDGGGVGVDTDSYLIPKFTGETST